MLTQRLEILLDPATCQWLQNFSEATGKSKGAITREAIAKVQTELDNNKTPAA